MIIVIRFLFSLAACVVLDWATFTPSLAPLGITPWNPSTGLGVAIVLTGGFWFAPILAVGPFVSDILVRALPLSWWVTALEAAFIGAGYWVGLTCLNRPRFGFDRRLPKLRDMLLLMLILGAAAAAVSIAYNTVLVLVGLLEIALLAGSVIRYWIGDVIGIVVMTPFLLLIANRREFPKLTF